MPNCVPKSTIVEFGVMTVNPVAFGGTVAVMVPWFRLILFIDFRFRVVGASRKSCTPLVSVRCACPCMRLMVPLCILGLPKRCRSMLFCVSIAFWEMCARCARVMCDCFVGLIIAGAGGVFFVMGICCVLSCDSAKMSITARAMDAAMANGLEMMIAGCVSLLFELIFPFVVWLFLLDVFLRSISCVRSMICGDVWILFWDIFWSSKGAALFAYIKMSRVFECWMLWSRNS